MYQGNTLDYKGNIAWLYTVPNDVLIKIKKEVDEIKGNFNNYRHNNLQDILIGNFEHEYKLSDCKDCVEKMIVNQISNWNESLQGELLNKILQYNLEHYTNLKLDKFWVNFQKKYEFNPPHIHSGLFSFVIWLYIPYRIEDEIKRLPDVRKNVCGQFSFLIATKDGVKEIFLPIDKSYNGTMAIFKADTMHEVYPFYTSDEYRITVSGNIVFNNEDK